MSPSSLVGGASNAGVLGFFVRWFRWKRVFSGQYSVGSVFHSTESRAGKSPKWETCVSRPKQTGAFILPQKPRLTGLSRIGGGEA